MNKIPVKLPKSMSKFWKSLKSQQKKSLTIFFVSFPTKISEPWMLQRSKYYFTNKRFLQHLNKAVKRSGDSGDCRKEIDMWRSPLRGATQNRRKDALPGFESHMWKPQLFPVWWQKMERFRSLNALVQRRDQQQVLSMVRCRENRKLRCAAEFLDKLQRQKDTKSRLEAFQEFWNGAYNEGKRSFSKERSQLVQEQVACGWNKECKVKLSEKLGLLMRDQELGKRFIFRLPGGKDE